MKVIRDSDEGEEVVLFLQITFQLIIVFYATISDLKHVRNAILSLIMHNFNLINHDYKVV